MNVLVVGPAACGKSEFAEDLVMRLGQQRVYIATMRPWGPDGQAKVARHRALRAGKGFETVECYGRLKGLDVPQGSTVLLECLGNLCNNTFFLPDGSNLGVEEVCGWHVADVCALAAQAKNLVVIGNEVGSDGQGYGPGLQEYIRLMGSLNCALAQAFDVVVEVSQGLPLVVKGELN